VDVDIQGHQFEILTLRREGEMWLAQFAIDGRKYPAFYEPYSNTVEMREEEFLPYMKSQSLAMMEYTRQQEAAA
jgi:hypothetical protein